MNRTQISRVSRALKVAVTLLLAIVPSFCFESCCCVAQDVCCCLAESDSCDSNPAEDSSCCQPQTEARNSCCSAGNCCETEPEKNSEEEGSDKGCKNCSSEPVLDLFEYRAFSFSPTQPDSAPFDFQPSASGQVVLRPSLVALSHQQRQSQLGVWIE